jgi:hypothetical protein
VIPKLKGSIKLDGRSVESAWEHAKELSLVQQRPNFGEEPSEETDVLIGYTSEALYMAARCYDSSKPSAPSFKRDYASLDSDQFGLLLDTFNDNENALAFITSPTGMRTDISISDDATGRNTLDVDWNAFWQVEVHQNAKGWFVEMRIPVSSLRFDTNESGRVVMGLTAVRFLSRKNEFDIFPNIPPKWGFYSHDKPSQARNVVFKDLQPQTPLRVTPYLLGGLGQQNKLNEVEAAYQTQTDPAYDAGLDIKYGLSNNFTMDLTVNTDFAQVEADNQQVNLTRFPLFFPEKRRFFLERASTFSFNFGQANRLFYSRRIGLFNRKQVRILGGARVVGRSGPWDIGVLNMQTAREPDLMPGNKALPSENFGVYRVQREVINENSNIGGILTHRLGMDGTYNVAYGVDGIFNLTGQQYLTAKWAQTFVDGQPNRAFSMDPARVQLKWERRFYKGFNYNLRYDRAGKDYEPGVGLELRENYHRFGDRIGYGWIYGEKSAIQRQRVNLEGEAYFRNNDGTIQSMEIGPSWQIINNTGHGLTFNASWHLEDLRAPFALSEKAEVPSGRYDFLSGELIYNMSTSRDLRTSLKLTAGEFYDGKRGSFQISPVWNTSRYLRINGFYQFNRLRFPKRDQSFNAHIGRLRALVTPNVEYSISTFVQYNSARGAVIGNLRFRYNPRQGNDLYIVYNERLNSDRSVTTGPRLPLSNQRTILVKYTYTFNW